MVGRAISFSPRRPRVGKARPPRATLCPVTWVDPDGLPFGGAGAGLMAGPSLRARVLPLAPGSLSGISGAKTTTEPTWGLVSGLQPLCGCRQTGFLVILLFLGCKRERRALQFGEEVLAGAGWAAEEPPGWEEQGSSRKRKAPGAQSSSVGFQSPAPDQTPDSGWIG